MRARLATHIFSLHIRNLVNYRVDFWVNWLFGIVATMAVAFFLWQAVFEQQGIESLRGYSFKGLMLYYVLALLVDKAVLGSGRGMLAADIYEGTLNRFLLYPVNLFGYKLAEQWASGAFAAGQGLLAWLFFVLVWGQPAEAPLSFASLAMGLTAVLAASMLFLLISFCIEMVAFWADNVWSLSVLMMFCIRLLGGSMIPLAFFPEHVQAWLHWLPFSVLSSFPIRCLMGQVGPAEWSQGLLMIAGWMLLFAVLARLIWKRGSLRYSGVGI